MSADKAALLEQNAENAKVLAEQDKKLNSAWFVFGTKKELKEQNILSKGNLFKKGQVLKSGDVNVDYFTEIAIRTTKEIKLYSKDADILTQQPEGSYMFERDSQGQLTLVITNPKVFWELSRYLVIQVK